MANGVSMYDPNLLVYCSYCINSFLDGSLNETLENLTERMAESTTLLVSTSTEEFEEYYDDVQPENITEDDSSLCDFAQGMDSRFLDRLLLFPASICIIFLSFFIQRKYLFKNVFNSRPGFIYPVNLLEGQDHRFSFVAGFLLVSWTMVDMVIGSGSGTKEAFPFYDYEIINNMRPFYMLAACIMRALEFYPIFASLTANNIFGFAVGSIYCAGIVFRFISDDRFCFSGTPASIAIQICRLLPPAICLLYLCLYFPFRFVQCLMRKMRRDKVKETQKSWQRSFNMLYVKELMNKHKIQSVPPTNLCDKIRFKLYCPLPTFKYSISILTAVFTGLCFTYMTTLFFLNMMYYLLEENKKALKFAMKATKFHKEWQQEIIAYIATTYDIDINQIYKEIIKEMIFWMNWVIQPVVYTSITIAFLSVFSSMLLTMKNYRHNLFMIYRNQHDDLQKFELFKPRGLLVNAVKYVGYQISYAAWGFVIQFGILWLILMFLMIIIILMFRYDLKSELLEWAFNKFWCVIATIILLMVVQNLMAHFLFLRRGDNKEKVLALDNRRVFFNFHYFAVFTNIAVGLISCILRIIRAVFFGLWTVPRLDMSTLSRDFERLDAGYMSYIGLLYLEHTQRNPTMLVFINMLLETINSDKKNYVTCVINKKSMTKLVTPRFRRVRNRYHLWITLERNPGLRLLRKNELGVKISLETDLRFRKMQLLNRASAKQKQQIWPFNDKVAYMEKNQTKF